MEFKFEEIEKPGEPNSYKSNTFEHPQTGGESYITIAYNRLDDSWTGVIHEETRGQSIEFTQGHESPEGVMQKVDEFAEQAGI